MIPLRRPSRSDPIMSICGLNGSGKTLLATSWCWEHLKDGGRVLSNVPLQHPQAAVLETIAQLDDARDCLVLLDEVTAWMPGRGWQSVPREVLAAIAQLRKRNLQLIWTSPSMDDADVQLRRVTVSSIICAPLFRTGWNAPLFVLSRRYDRDLPGPYSLWSPKWAPSWGKYDTTAIITPAGAAGYCAECGFRIKPDKTVCACKLPTPPIIWRDPGPQHAFHDEQPPTPLQ